MRKPSASTAVEICDGDEAAQLIGGLEEIAADLNWQPGGQIRAYAASAVHFAAYSGGVLAGGMQLVPASLCETLPCERVWPEVLLPRRAETAHISIMAVKREYRGTADLLWPLCVAMWRYCAAHRITDISLEVTPDLYRLYRRLGWPLEIVGELRLHWGEDCYLCRMGVAEVAGAMVIKATQASRYQAIVGLMCERCKSEQSKSEQSKPAGPIRPTPIPASSLQPDALSGIVVREQL